MVRNVLLTGASRGIGEAIKKYLITSGGYNIISPIRHELDLCNDLSIKKYIDNLKTNIDILINNAGINNIEYIEKVNDLTIQEMITINLISPIKLIKSLIPYMKKNKFGRIINISSIWGIRSKEKRGLYSATKFGINGITKALARELGTYNILVNSVCPGYVNTDLTKKNIPQAEQEKILKDIPLGRFAEPVEVAKLIEFLISENNTYITGQSLIIDGGFLS